MARTKRQPLYVGDVTGGGGGGGGAGVWDPAGTAAAAVAAHELAYNHHAPVTLSAAADVLLSLSTQEIGLDNQDANLIFAGPTAGEAAAPTFRAMVEADLGTGLSPTFAGLGIALTGAKTSTVQVGDPTTITVSAYDKMSVNQSGSGSQNWCAFKASVEFTGTTNTANPYQGLQAFACTHASSTGNLTATSAGGGLRNRYSIRHAGTGLVSLASTLSATMSLIAGCGGITEAAAFNAESPSVATGTTLGTFAGVAIRGGSVSGTLTTRYGVLIENLVGGTTRYAVYQAGANDLNYFAGLTYASDIYPRADDTYYLGKNDDDSPLAWKGVILKDTANGKYYRVEVINGVVTPTDLTD